MTPVPIDLPLLPSEAVELANLIFALAERKPLNDDVRNRVAARASHLPVKSLRPYPGSLERDPVHHSTYYLAVDGAGGEPLMLHIASGAAPTSSIFTKPLLIGRTRQPDGRDIVINAVPFGAADRGNLERFTAKAGAAFLPRPQGSRAAIVTCGSPSFEAMLTWVSVSLATAWNLS